MLPALDPLLEYHARANLPVSQSDTEAFGNPWAIRPGIQLACHRHRSVAKKPIHPADEDTDFVFAWAVGAHRRDSNLQREREILDLVMPI